MKPRKNQDYSTMTKLAAKLGLIQYKDRMGRDIPGFYTMEDLEAPIDLTASAHNEVSILKNALRQLSETVNESYHQSIERDLND